MKRRQFLKMIAGASVMAACPLAGTTHASQTPALTKPLTRGLPAKVFLAGIVRNAPDNDIKDALRRTAEAATDFSWLSKGDSVLIKPVINSGNPYPATTSPLAVAAMIQLLKEKGAGRVIVGDMSGVEHVRFSPLKISGSSRALAESGGMAKAVQTAGGELHFFEEAGWNAFYEDAPQAGAHWKRAIMMPNILKEVQHIALMPRCGRHLLAGCSLGFKAAVGYWRHDTRLEYHHDASTLHAKTAEANTVKTLLDKQRLVVTTADKVLTTFGPDNGYVHQPDTGLMIASSSIVAHDMVSLAWLLDNRADIPNAEKNSFMDTSRTAAWFGNRVVVDWLGGLGQAVSSEGFHKNPLMSVWDDITLNRAYEIYGGVPLVSLECVDKIVPENVIKQLGSMTAYPS
jgi:uncharacterized protein (DUF362 family)